MQYTQFPWRWLSLNVTALALLSPALAAALQRRGTDLARHTYTVLAAAVLVINVGLYGGPGPSWFRWEFDPSTDRIRAAKTRTTADEEYGPVWRKADFSHPVRAGNALFENAEVKPEAAAWRWQIGPCEATTPVVLGVNYFPGWQASWHASGASTAAELPVEVDRPTGLILIQLAPGASGSLSLNYTNTPLRLALKIFSAASLAVFLALAIYVRFRRPPAIV